MKKNVQKRLLTVAKVLTLAEDEKSMWRKFFSNKDKGSPTPPPPAASKLTPEEFLKEREEYDENVGNVAPTRSKGKSPLNKKPPVLQEKSIPTPDAGATKDFAAFLSGKGSVPFELVKPLKQISDVLSATGTISVKDSSNVVMFLSKMLRKYLAGQKLAKVATTARKARVATATPEYLKKYLLVSE